MGNPVAAIVDLGASIIGEKEEKKKARRATRAAQEETQRLEKIEQERVRAEEANEQNLEDQEKGRMLARQRRFTRRQKPFIDYYGSALGGTVSEGKTLLGQ